MRSTVNELMPTFLPNTIMFSGSNFLKIYFRVAASSVDSPLDITITKLEADIARFVF